MRTRVFITPRESFATSPPYRAPSAPQKLPFLVGFQYAGRKIRQNFAFEDCQGDEALLVRGQHLDCHPAFTDLDEPLFAPALLYPDGFLPAHYVAHDELLAARYPLRQRAPTRTNRPSVSPFRVTVTGVFDSRIPAKFALNSRIPTLVRGIFSHSLAVYAIIALPGFLGAVRGASTRCMFADLRGVVQV